MAPSEPIAAALSRWTVYAGCDKNLSDAHFAAWGPNAHEDHCIGYARRELRSRGWRIHLMDHGEGEGQQIVHLWPIGTTPCDNGSLTFRDSTLLGALLDAIKATEPGKEDEKNG